MIESVVELECRGDAQTPPGMATTCVGGSDVADDTAGFWARVDRSGGPDACWPWLGKLYEGYGQARGAGLQARAYRVAWILTHGPLAAGLEVDHQCHNRDLSCPGGPSCVHRQCCNPAHLEPATRLENARRRLRSQVLSPELCLVGHPLGGDNLYVRPDGRRECRACAKASRRKYWARLGSLPPNEEKP